MRAWVTGLVLTAALAAPAAAHDDDRDRRHRDGRRSGAYGIGYDNGYEEGRREGRSDGDRGQEFGFTRDSRYRRGDVGYRSRYGSRDAYEDGYRSGYREGYRDGYRRRRAYGYGGYAPVYGGYAPAYGSYGHYDDAPYGYVAAKKHYGPIYDWRADGRHRHRGGPGFCLAVH